MSSLMTTLQQPLSVAVLAQCLGLASRPARPTMRRRSRSLRDSRRCAPGADVDGFQAPGFDEPATAACGWFESSHELHHGLVVLEHSGVEGLGGELPVTVWLKLALDGAADTVQGAGAWGGPATLRA